MTAYITTEALKASLSLSGETYADNDIALAITAASELIEEQCNRRFTLDEDATNARVYRPRNRLVVIDDVVQVTTVAVGPGDGTYPTVLTMNTDYELTPLNAAADHEPYTAIRLHRACWGYSTIPHDRRRVQVTGQFGWLSVPDLVLSATSLLAGRIVRRIREAPFGIIQMGLDGQPARIAQMDPDIASMLMPLTRMLVR